MTSIAFVIKKCYCIVVSVITTQLHKMTTVEEILTQNVPDVDKEVFDYICGTFEDCKSQLAWAEGAICVETETRARHHVYY